MFGAILKATNSSFQKGMAFCRSIYVKKVMKLLAFIFEQPSYKCFKSQFCIEHYFNCIAYEKHRIQLTRFRCSSHSLEIETARYNRNHIDRAERICKCCNMNMTEDEYHFLLICPLFS